MVSGRQGHRLHVNPARSNANLAEAGSLMAYNYNMNTLLNYPTVADVCRHRTTPITLEMVAETGSTNSDLLARIATLPGPTLRIAERQTAGRGRAGRPWHSAPGASLTFSLAWPFARGVQQLQGLPLAVGVALAEALAALAVPVTLKWPNDLLKDGKKLAGILIETATADSLHAASPSTWAVIGLGLNLRMPEALEAQIGHPAAAAPNLAQLDRALLMATFLHHLRLALSQFAQQGFQPFAARWNQLHAYAGQAVVVSAHGQAQLQGYAVGVDDVGRLLLDTPTGREAVLAGDVSLHLAASPTDVPLPEKAR